MHNFYFINTILIFFVLSSNLKKGSILTFIFYQSNNELAVKTFTMQ